MRGAKCCYCILVYSRGYGVVRRTQQNNNNIDSMLFVVCWPVSSSSLRLLLRLIFFFFSHSIVLSKKQHQLHGNVRASQDKQYLYARMRIWFFLSFFFFSSLLFKIWCICCFFFFPSHLFASPGNIHINNQALTSLFLSSFFLFYYSDAKEREEEKNEVKNEERTNK